MKITIYYGSIHKKRGNTYVIINEFAEGARKAGADVDVVLLAEKKINNCVACMKCHTKTPGKCVLQDDMAELLEIFIKSDIVVMATPVYLHNVTGMMKTFIDRMAPLMEPYMIRLDSGYTGHVKRYDKYPNFIVIGTLSEADVEKEQIFKDIVHRNMLNNFAEKYSSQVIYTSDDSQTIETKIEECISIVGEING